MSEPEQFEVLILGSGEAGKLLAWHMAGLGQRTTVVERRWIGGSCPNIACLPSKNEIWSARVAYLTKHAAQFGTMIAGAVTTDMESSKAQAQYGRGGDCLSFAQLPDNRQRTDHGGRAVCGAEDARGAAE